MPTMPQTSTIAAALIVGFIVFITVRGELPKYLAILGLGSQATSTSAASSSPLSNPVLNVLSTAAGLG